MEGFTLEGPRAGDWRVASGLLAIAGFSLGLAAMYGSLTALIWPVPIVVLAAGSFRRWYDSPRVRLAVSDLGVSYSLRREDAPVPWSKIQSFSKQTLGPRVCVVLVLVDGEELPLDPAALGLKADELVMMLDGYRRAMIETLNA